MRRAVGRPGGAVVENSRRAGERARHAGRELDDPELLPVQVVTRVEGVGDVPSVGRDGGVPPSSPRSCRRRVTDEPLRPRIVDLDDREPSALVALDVHDQPRVVEPDGCARFDELPRRAARAGTIYTQPSSA